MEKKLALFGGPAVFPMELPLTNNLGNEEKEAVLRVMERGILSNFVARWDNRFYGGSEILGFEKKFCERFKVTNAVSFNSATTALHAAIAAAKIGPGDEVITSPYTMAATPAAVLMNQAIPIFADIDEQTFCLDPDDVERKITSRTKAILAVNLFGHMPDYDKLIRVVRQHNLILIEDCAQSPGAIFKGKLTGTIGDIGVFSFNFHKTMQCGEGGVLVTNNNAYALRAQLIRNHGEVVIDEMPEGDPRKQEVVLGSNYRLSELHAAIANEQLKKLDFLTKERIALAEYLTRGLRNIVGITPPFTRENSSHVYYLYPFKYDENYWGIPRTKFAQALRAEGAPVAEGYVKPLYLTPLYQRKKAYNETNYPFVSEYYNGNPNYGKGSCPVVERMYEKSLLTTNICRYPLTTKHMDFFLEAIRKIDRHKGELRDNV